MRASTTPLLVLSLLAACGGGRPEVPAEPGTVEVIGAPLDQPPPLGLPPLGVDPAVPPPLGALDFSAPEPPAPLEIEVEPGSLHEISFAHLSLLGADTGALIDLMFAGDPSTVEFEFPASVAKLDGERVSLVGYQIGLEYDESDPDGPLLTRFMLVRDLAICCFGGIPRPDEWIDVTVSEPVPLWLYRPVRVTGALSVGLERQEDALMTSVFQVKGAGADLER